MTKHYNLNIEKSVLSSLMSIQDSYIRIANIIQASDFYAQRHQNIFSAIAYLANRNEPYDAMMVKDVLITQNLIESSGGSEYLGEILSQSPATLFNLTAYAQRVREFGVLRQAEQALRDGLDILNQEGDYVHKINNIIGNLTSVLSEKARVKGARSISDIFPDFFKETLLMTKNQQTPFIKTGFEEIDNRVEIQSGELVVIAGRPASGKTTLAQNILQHVVDNTNGVGVFFSLEMAENQVMQRFTSAMADIPLRKVKSGQGFEEDELARFVELRNKLQKPFNLYIDDRVLSIAEMRTELNRLRNKHGKIGIIMVDYVQIIKGINKTASGERSSMIADITTALKTFSKEYDCPVIALAQLSREAYGIPMMSHIAESGGIERIADHIWALYHPPVEEGKEAEKDKKVNLYILKQRQGSIGMIELSFKGELNKFDNNIPNNDIPAKFLNP